MKNNSIKALLFDLGGVVIDIDFNLVFTSWATSSNSSVEGIQSKFSFDEFYEVHERGEIDSAEYFKSLRTTLEIDISDQQFEEGWNSIYKGEVSGMFDLLRSIKGELPIYAFTNSNHVHEKVWSKRYSKILNLFEIIFNSSNIGKRKPEPDAFQFIANSIGIKLQEIVFFDDFIDNIVGAQKVGLRTVHVQSISDIEASFKTIYK